MVSERDTIINLRHYRQKVKKKHNKNKCVYIKNKLKEILSLTGKCKCEKLCKRSFAHLLMSNQLCLEISIHMNSRWVILVWIILRENLVVGEEGGGRCWFGSGMQTAQPPQKKKTQKKQTNKKPKTKRTTVRRKGYPSPSKCPLSVILHLTSIECFVAVHFLFVVWFFYVFFCCWFVCCFYSTNTKNHSFY